MPGYDTGVWWGVLAPAGLPADDPRQARQGCRRRAEGAGREGAVHRTRRAPDRLLARRVAAPSSAPNTKNGARSSGPPESRRSRADGRPLPAAARTAAGRSSDRRRTPATRMPRVRPGLALSLRGGPQLHAARRAARENISTLLDTLGFARGALVQGSAHGHDNSAMLDALEREPKRLRGVAVADANTRRPNCAAGMRSACAGCASIIFSAAGNCIIAAACRSMPRERSRR